MRLTAPLLIVAALAGCQRPPADFAEVEALPPTLAARLPAEARGMPLLTDPAGCLYFTAMGVTRPLIDPLTEFQICAPR